MDDEMSREAALADLVARQTQVINKQESKLTCRESDACMGAAQR